MKDFIAQRGKRFVKEELSNKVDMMVRGVKGFLNSVLRERGCFARL